MIKMAGKYDRTYKLNVTTKAIQLCAENPKRKGLLVYNNGDETVYVLSAPNLGTGDGMPVAAGSSYDDEQSTCRKWIIADSGTQDVRVEVVSD